MVAVVEYGAGNIRSVLNALHALGEEATMVSRAEDIGDADRVILPGVGAFGDCMRRLDERGFAEALPRLAGAGRPLLGICLGMQLLATRSFEHGEHAGLDLIAGEVRRIEPDGDARVPHIGWNAVDRRRPGGLLGDEEGEQTFYFVHSFHLETRDPAAVTGTTTHGGTLTAVVEQAHVGGCQFHPEKSQDDGLALLRRFLDT